MRTLTSITCVSLLVLLTACGNSTRGYYDAQGNWVTTSNTHHRAHPERDLPPDPGHTYDKIVGYEPAPSATVVYTAPPPPMLTYERAGYYDRNGYYIAMDGGLTVPDNMFPPAGQCRIWMPGVPVVNQAPVEPCYGIQARVPPGGYVIYGG